MFKRNILNNLNNWKNSKRRKPLIIRGARQTGKTVAVDMFGETFSNYIWLNLEKEADRRIFERSRSLDEVIQGIEMAKKGSLREEDTLLFIDEIQNSSKAVQMLRFFYEDYPRLAVVAAGSLLEAIMVREGFSFPVGRVEFLYLYPVTFDEFLLAMGEEKLLGALLEVGQASPLPPIIHDMALKLFHQYLLVGGMPEAVAGFIEDKSFQSLVSIKEGLMASFEDDVSKYSRLSEAKYLKHVINYAPHYVGERIKYENFGNSGYRSREMKKAFDLLEYAMIVQRIYGSHSIKLPIQPNFNVSPKLLYVDVGLVSYKLGISEDAIYVQDLNDLFRGALAEQIVGQTFCSIRHKTKYAPSFWYRNRPGSTAEVDYVIQFKDRIIPVEVKSGKSGKLRSLHQFMLSAPHDMAIRLYSGPLCEEKVNFRGRDYRLLSVPLYLQWRLDSLLEG